MKAFPIILFISLHSFSFAQTEKLNQFDDKGKKDGKWIVYLDSKGWNAKDSSKAAYYKYTYYDHGDNIYPMGGFIGKNEKLEHVETDVQKNQKIKLLDGEYKCYDKNGKLKFIHIFNKGEYVLYEELYPAGELNTRFDHSKKWLAQPHTYFIDIHKQNGRTEYYYMRKGPSGWMFYGTYIDSTVIDTSKVIGDSAFVTIQLFKQAKKIGTNNRIFVKDPKTQEVTYIMNGHFIEWHTNGQKESEGEYHYGKKVGEWHYWGENGNEIKKSK